MHPSNAATIEGSHMTTALGKNEEIAPVARPAMSIDSLLSASKATSEPKPQRPAPVSDLLMVVLEKYGIDADEFLRGIDD